ncbi:MAG: glycosyltransferase family 39 protein [Verrucomicrobiota bacterium]
MKSLVKRYSWLLFAGLVFFTLLGQRGLNEPDEGRYAEIGREMNVDGDWLVPHMNGMPHVQKPPVIYWLTAISLRAFGHHDWAARFPSAMMALGTVIVTYLAALRLFGARSVAVQSALVLTTLAGFFAMSRLLTPDMTMTFWITAAITAALYRKHGWFFILMGLGFLTKGPMALVVPLGAVLGWQWKAMPEEKLDLPWKRGLLLTLGISLSWFITLAILDHRLFDYFWRYELVERFGSSTHGRSKPFWFFFAILPAALLPWVFTLPLRRIWQRCRAAPFTAWQTLLLGWIILPLSILSFSGSKLPTYILPLMPAFALGIACTLPSLRRAWVVALPTAVCLIALDFVISQNNDHFGVQASSRELVVKLREQEPDVHEAILFACETRAEGLAYYAETLMKITRRESDLTGTPTAEQATHLYASAQDCAAQLTDGPTAHGIVRTGTFQKRFDLNKWRVIATAGEFSLVANHASHAPSL